LSFFTFYDPHLLNEEPWELFEHEKTLFIPRPQYCMPLDGKWNARPNITLLGDAAHWMPPFAGEGVNMAMLDALQLSQALTDSAFCYTKAAIAHYEKQIFARFAKIGQATLFNTEWMHRPNALNDMLAMFSKNKFKQNLLIAKYVINVRLIPLIRKVAGFSPGQKVLRKKGSLFP
jgi:2-polyprenyl-6-methoxyphenol hydroxylase-like FAD-dependent oxidoreductase